MNIDVLPVADDVPVSAPVIPDPAEQPMMTVPEVAAALGLGRSATYDAVKRGTIQSVRLGRKLLVPTATVCEMVGVRAAEPSAVARATVGARTISVEFGSEVPMLSPRGAAALLEILRAAHQRLLDEESE